MCSLLYISAIKDQCFQFFVFPTNSQQVWIAAKRFLRYLVGSKKTGLLFTSSPSGEMMKWGIIEMSRVFDELTQLESREYFIRYLLQENLRPSTRDCVLNYTKSGHYSDTQRRLSWTKSYWLNFKKLKQRNQNSLLQRSSELRELISREWSMKTA